MREFWTFFASAALVFVGVLYGYKFLRLRNYLLGYEWWILAVSSSSGVLFAFWQVQAAGTLWHFLDLFSKLFGIPLIAGLGLLRVTHDYEPAPAVDAAVFAGSIIGSVYLFLHPELGRATEMAVLVANGGYGVVLSILTYQLFRYGLRFQGFLLMCTMALNIYVSLFEDFLVLASGDHMPVHLSKFVTASLTWSVSFWLTYVFYVSLARAKGMTLARPGRNVGAARATA